MRVTRPEPFEHAFGAEAHPAEAATSDPAQAPAAAPRTNGTSPSSEPTPGNPSATPEQ
ncbi:MAG: hypothetical protein QM736_28080 [Vicinamibacterales bacterium]